jgi:hypothetical protein
MVTLHGADLYAVASSQPPDLGTLTHPSPPGPLAILADVRPRVDDIQNS